MTFWLTKGSRALSRPTRDDTTRGSAPPRRASAASRSARTPFRQGSSPGLPDRTWSAGLTAAHQAGRAARPGLTAAAPPRTAPSTSPPPRRTRPGSVRVRCTRRTVAFRFTRCTVRFRDRTGAGTRHRPVSAGAPVQVFGACPVAIPGSASRGRHPGVGRPTRQRPGCTPATGRKRTTGRTTTRHGRGRGRRLGAQAPRRDRRVLGERHPRARSRTCTGAAGRRWRLR